MHGPTGTGKTALALALARHSGLNVVVVHSSSVRSKFVGESETALAQLVAQARSARPALLVLDQVEALAPSQVSRWR